MEETLEILQDNLGQALIDTAYMVVVSAIIGVVLGTLVALLLYLTENRLFTPNHALNVIVGFIVNAIRSLPFLACLKLPSPLVPPHAKSLWMRYSLRPCRRSFVVWCSPLFH